VLVPSNAGVVLEPLCEDVFFRVESHARAAADPVELGTEGGGEQAAEGETEGRTFGVPAEVVLGAVSRVWELDSLPSFGGVVGGNTDVEESEVAKLVAGCVDGWGPQVT